MLSGGKVRARLVINVSASVVLPEPGAPTTGRLPSWARSSRRGDWRCRAGSSRRPIGAAMPSSAEGGGQTEPSHIFRPDPSNSDDRGIEEGSGGGHGLGGRLISIRLAALLAFSARGWGP